MPTPGPIHITAVRVPFLKELSMAKFRTLDRTRFRAAKRLSLYVLAASAIALALSDSNHEAAEVGFERLELAFDRPIDDWICKDIDGDGDADLVLLRVASGPSQPNHEATVIWQRPTGRFAYQERQVFSLQSASGMYDLGDVAGGPSLELIQVTNSGVRYFALAGENFDTVPRTLINPVSSPTIPAVAIPQAWDFVWPLVPGEKECVALPYLDRLDLWRPADTSGGSFSHTATIACNALSRRPVDAWSTGYRMLFPELQAQSTPGALDLFFESASNWHGVRRSSRNKTDFVTSLDFGIDPASVGQVLGIRPEFHSGCVMQDLNGDGIPDVVQWRNNGGINAASCQVQIYFGPLNDQLPENPHDEILIEGVYGFPRFGDLNGDGRLDMLVCAMETGSLSTAKMFVMKKLSFQLLVYRQRPDNSFSAVADHRQKADYRLNLDIPLPVSGPIITFAGDLDNDGFEDFVMQTGQDRLDIFRGHAIDMIDEDSPERLDCRQAISIKSTDIDGDGRLDLLLHHAEQGASESITVLLAR